MRLKNVLFFLTYRCNLRCDFCLSFQSYWGPDASIASPVALAPSLFLKPVKHDQELSTEQICTEVLPKLERSNIDFLALSGGDILVRKDINHIFDALGKASFDWCFDSNLMLLKEDTAHSIFKNQCDTIFVSIDGPEPIHNSLRGTPKGFQKTIEKIKLLQEIKSQSYRDSRTKLVVNCVVQNGNEAYLDDVAKICTELDVDTLGYQLLSKHTYTPPFDSATAYASLQKAKERAKPFKISVYPISDPDEDILKNWFTTPEKISSPADFQCDYIHESLRIDPQGNVIPCIENTMGNVLNDEIYNIWSSEAYEQFRTALKSQGPLSACHRCCNISHSAAEQHPQNQGK